MLSRRSLAERRCGRPPEGATGGVAYVLLPGHHKAFGLALPCDRVDGFLRFRLQEAKCVQACDCFLVGCVAGIFCCAVAIPRRINDQPAIFHSRNVNHSGPPRRSHSTRVEIQQARPEVSTQVTKAWVLLKRPGETPFDRSRPGKPCW
jgi:hypothetical protein